MQWTKGQPWRVVNGLQKLNEQIRAYAPRSVPPATDPNAWGSLADSAHSTDSDHYPHFYSALGTTAVVCARDFPHAPALGLNGGVVTEALRVSRDPRIGYLIFNRRITGPNHGWTWQAYDGSDPHDTHFHVSSVHTAAADDTRAWVLPGGAQTIMEALMYAGTFFSCSGVTNSPKFFGIPGVLCTWVQAAEETSLNALEDGQWIDQIAPAHSDGAAPTVSRKLINIVGDVPAGFEDRAAVRAVDAAGVAAALASNEAFLTAVANAVGSSVKDQFGPAFDKRIKDAARAAVDARLDDDAST